MGEEIAKDVFGYNADIALDMIVEHEFCSNSRLVLTTPAVPPPI